jgi:hypothetical protein
MLASPEPNTASFVDDLTRAYSKTCPQQPSPPGKLLILQTSPQANLGLDNVIQTWMPVRQDLLIFSEINGWAILTLVFFISLAYQIYFYDRTRRKQPPKESYDTSYFERPCLARWMEYALTSPLQIMLIASSVMIRDVYTVMLLVAAQVVCVLLGFALECAMAVPADNAGYNALAFKDPGPDKEANAVQEANAPSIPHTSLWLLCFGASAVLHFVVWYVLLNQLSNVSLETECQSGPRDWVLPLQLVIYGQGGLFTLFAVIPAIQQFRIRWSGKPIDRTLLAGSVAYAILSVTAKLFLGISYIFFVALFPFETADVGLSR